MDFNELRSRHRQEEIELIRNALDAAQWNVKRAAKALDMQHQTLYRQIQRVPSLAADLLLRGWDRGRPRKGRGSGK